MSPRIIVKGDSFGITHEQIKWSDIAGTESTQVCIIKFAACYVLSCLTNLHCHVLIPCHIPAVKYTVGRDTRVQSAIDSGASGVFLLEHIVLQVRKMILNCCLVDAINSLFV